MPTTITLTVADKFSGPLEKFAGELNKADGAADKLAAGMKQADAAAERLGTSTRKSGLSFTELNQAVSLAQRGLQLIKGAYDATIGTTLEYADQVRNLGRAIGASAEESSKLIQAADDVFVSFDQLQTGMRAAIRKGFEPSIEGLGKLSDAYLAIQDPIERTKFLMDTFGRSGADLAPLMEKGAAGIKKMGDAAEDAGQVLSQQDLKATLELKEAIDSLQDSVQGLVLSFSRDAIPVLRDWAKAEADALSVQHEYNRAVEEGILTQQDMVQIRLADMFGARAWGLEALHAAEARAKLSAQLQTSRGIIRENTHAVNEGTGSWAEYAAISAAVEAAERKKAKALEETAKAANAGAAAAEDLGVLINGPLGKINEEYYKQQKDTGAEIAKVRAELEKLRASQGMAYTTTTKATVSQADYTIALDRAALAQRKYNEYTGDSPTALEGLRIAAESAQNSVDKMGAKLGVTSSGYVDNSTKIGELETKLGELTGAYDANAKAHEDATRRILFGFLSQELAVDGLTQKEYEVLAGVGKAWGLLDTDTARALESMKGNLASFNADGNVRTFIENFTGVHDVYYNVHVSGIPTTPIGDEDFNNWTQPAVNPHPIPIPGPNPIPNPVPNPLPNDPPPGPGGIQAPTVIVHVNGTTTDPYAMGTVVAAQVKAAWRAGAASQGK